MTRKQLSELIHAGFTGIWIETSEPEEAAREIASIAHSHNLTLDTWQCVNTEPPIDAINKARDIKPAIHCYLNLHRFFDSPFTIQAFYNAIIQGKSERCFHIIIAPTVQIPLELQKHIIVIEHQLPNAQELNQIAKELTNNTDDAPTEIIDAAAGLTRYEAEGAFALSLVRHKKLNPDAIWEIKANTVKKSKTLTLHRNGDSFKKIGGLNGLKAFCLQAMASKTQYAKGVLLLGVPGTGKSAFAKALGSESGRPTLTLDLGALMGSLVGQTEANIRQALKIADAMQPCILFVDEIEKALAGSTSSFQGDSGVSARMLGTLLTWLNDHQSNVFFIGTCNDISKLPTEFTRAERFDAVWFLDLPTPTQREAIWNIYLQGNDAQKPDDTNWTGAEIASCCRLAAMLNTTLQQAAQYVIPVAVTAEGRINDLRDWATNRCLDAETGQVYKPNASKHTRRVYK